MSKVLRSNIVLFGLSNPHAGPTFHPVHKMLPDANSPALTTNHPRLIINVPNSNPGLSPPNPHLPDSPHALTLSNGLRLLTKRIWSELRTKTW
jgi:hypothetical protein